MAKSDEQRSVDKRPVPAPPVGKPIPKPNHSVDKPAVPAPPVKK